jgi:hypothetical protein
MKTTYYEIRAPINEDEWVRIADPDCDSGFWDAIYDTEEEALVALKRIQHEVEWPEPKAYVVKVTEERITD